VRQSPFRLHENEFCLLAGRAAGGVRKSLHRAEDGLREQAYLLEAGVSMMSLSARREIAVIEPTPIAAGRYGVLIVVRELDLGGVERDAARIAIRLDKSRFDAHVASYRDFGIRFDELRRSGIPLLHFPVTSPLSRGALESAIRMRRYVRQHRISVVHAFDPSAVFAAPVARAIGVPAVLASQLGSRKLLDKKSHWCMRLTDRIVDKVIVNCEAMRRHLIEDEGVHPGRIELCYNGVDTSEFYPNPGVKPRIEGIGDASLVIGAVCVLRPEKALHLLQQAFARVRHLDPAMRLVIVGGGPELPRLQAEGVRLGIAGHCVFLPPSREVPKLLHAIDIFVSCSSSEAFSNAILEAMTSGCAVVGSRVGGTPELLGDCERGLLFRSGDPDDLAAKLATLIRDASLRREFGRRAAEHAARTWSIGAAAARMSEIYMTVLAGKRLKRAGVKD
jgi:glycosyltransferase involved in cell wall biosynthesis